MFLPNLEFLYFLLGRHFVTQCHYNKPSNHSLFRNYNTYYGRHLNNIDMPETATLFFFQVSFVSTRPDHYCKKKASSDVCFTVSPCVDCFEKRVFWCFNFLDLFYLCSWIEP